MTENKLPEVGKRYRNKTNNLRLEILGFLNKHDMAFYRDIDCSFEFCGLIRIEKLKTDFEELPDQPTSAKSAQVGSEKVEEQEINFSAGGIFLADRGSHQVNFVTKEVQEAKEKLKELTQSFNRNPFTKEDGYFMKGVDSDRLLSLSWDIINALEEQKEDAILDRVFATPEPEEEPAISEKETTENIWKPISELPEGSYNVYIKWLDGDILPMEFLENYKTEYTRKGKNMFRNMNNGALYERYDSRIKSYCTLTDFVNQQEAIAKNQEIIFAEIAKLKKK